MRLAQRRRAKRHLLLEKQILQLLRLEQIAGYDGFVAQRHHVQAVEPPSWYIMELVSEVVPKALTSFVQNGIRCQQRP